MKARDVVDARLLFSELISNVRPVENLSVRAADIAVQVVRGNQLKQDLDEKSISRNGIR